MNILCQPRSLFNWNYDFSGPELSGSTRLNHFTEQGEIVLNGSPYPVVKDGFLSGQWRLEQEGKTLLTARKPNPLTRRFELTGSGITATLVASSPFSRGTVLTSEAGVVEFKRAHPFTRKARITGDQCDLTLVAFAFWLSALTWRRAASNNGGGSS